ncbi:helix-turn-helix domain-containing protein [Photobacterium leiognathi]|uniref:helix-turn-helix domain-containing protein n=1 Tax=Photobacterium leiognathi TaxID=553611 RepID=UPI000D15FA72|nr:helix-turn-helix domain-containing protein [Photobacterium leiognathi]PSW46033.1 Fis family transcriptional regulator [Photobacterium leiognathi subsp. mandapamensis]
MKEQLRKSISKDVVSAVKNHLASMEGLRVTELYDLVWEDIEFELIDAVLIHTRGNQSKAARMLGIDRNTLIRIRSKKNTVTRKRMS